MKTMKDDQALHRRGKLHRFGSSVLSPALTPLRIRLAFALAVVGDGAQFALGPLGWSWLDEIFDLLLAALIIPILGFHPLLLPTFLLEMFPVVDMLPTWTGCVAIVVALRKKELNPLRRG
jgi:hypothetical protein